ncbi:MAG TPA: MFS transporter [Rhodanobacteraceae bacterium]|nr:MFS transporter [Rhodanobacteraceae bacterium]
MERTSGTANVRWMWIAACGIAVLYVGSTLLTPLYPIYEREFGFDELVVTEIYAIYVLGNLAVLFFFGRLADGIGRRPVVLIALAVTIASAACFLVAGSTLWLFVARVLNGVGAGLGASALTAWLAELEPNGDRARAAAFASAGNLAGLAFGAIGAGLLVRFAPSPLRLPFAMFIGVLIIVIALLAFAPETVSDPARSMRELSLRPRVGVPSGIRLAFVAPAAIAFTAFALGGFYAALAPGLLSGRLDETGAVAIGGIVALFFAAGAVTVVVTRALSNRPALFAASALLLAGLALLLAADVERSMPFLIAASVAAGASMALGYRSSLGIVNAIAPGAQRAEVVSSYLLVCYAANALPVIGVGLLAKATSPTAAHAAFAILLALLGIAACAIGARHLPKE